MTHTRSTSAVRWDSAPRDDDDAPDDDDATVVFGTPEPRLASIDYSRVRGSTAGERILAAIDVGKSGARFYRVESYLDGDGRLQLRIIYVSIDGIARGVMTIRPACARELIEALSRCCGAIDDEMTKARSVPHGRRQAGVRRYQRDER
jgi:hypothetical protein